MLIDFRNTGGSGGPSISVEALTATENKVYTAPEGTAYSPVDVQVPIPTFETEEKTVSIVSNGQTVVDKSADKDGMTKVTVDVAVPIPEFTTEELTATENKVYTPTTNGYSKVTVNVPQEGGADFTGTGYDAEMQSYVNNKLQSDLDYTAQKYAEWNPENTSLQERYKGDRKLVYAPAISTSKVTSANACFYECHSLTTIPQLDFSSVTDASNCFYNCSSLTTIPQLDFSSVTSATYCFGYCSSLTTIPQLDFSSVTSATGCFTNCYSLTTTPALGFSSVTNASYCFQDCSSLTTIPQLDFSSVTDARGCFSNCISLTSLELTGGIRPDCECTDMFRGIQTNGTLYYHLPGDYIPVINALPSTWTAVPLGEITIKIRVLKDTVWLEGAQNLVIEGKTLNYNGKGIYSNTYTFTKEGPKPNMDIMLDGQKIGTAKVSIDEQIIEVGDNSSLIVNKVGADILTIVPEGGNADGWAYDEQVKGVKSAKITGSQSTTLKLNVPSNFTMVYGQDSEANYDYARLLNGAGDEIASFNGMKTGPDGQERYVGSTNDGIVQARYTKDGSGDSGLDAFWIKSISYIVYPAYPEV